MLAVTVIGNIGNDAEIKEFNGQKFIASTLRVQNVIKTGRATNTAVQRGLAA